MEFDRIRERVYTNQNPEIVAWTEYFSRKTHEANIFAELENEFPSPSIEKSKVVAARWHQFSEFMPWFLCQAAAKMTTNEKRHYVIQTAFEELGMRDVTEIHSGMFWKSAMVAGATPSDRDRICNTLEGHGLLQFLLRDKLMKMRSDDEVLGILLGLEIPARENIETVFTSLAHTADLANELTESQFFALHRQIEIEHVRLTVSNFLRFCTTDEARARFIRGFDAGINFWKSFWTTIARLVRLEMTRVETSKLEPSYV